MIAYNKNCPTTAIGRIWAVLDKFLLLVLDERYGYHDVSARLGVLLLLSFHTLNLWLERECEAALAR